VTTLGTRLEQSGRIIDNGKDQGSKNDGDNVIPEPA
jgi:hypothetical protein